MAQKYPASSEVAKDGSGLVDRLFKYLSDVRFRYERQWYINWAFYENNHFVWWNKNTRTIDKISPRKGTSLRVIPKARRQIEAIQNMALSGEQRWTVYPRSFTEGDKAVQEAKGVHSWLENKWDELGMRDKLD